MHDNELAKIIACYSCCVYSVSVLCSVKSRAVLC